MIKLFLIIILLMFTLTGCEKEKQASAEIGAVPKQILDKTTSDLKSAETLAAEKLKEAENEDPAKMPDK